MWTAPTWRGTALWTGGAAALAVFVVFGLGSTAHETPSTPSPSTGPDAPDSAQTLSAAPTLHWTVDGTDDLPQFGEVAPHAKVSLELDLPRKSFVYAVSFDIERGTLALFPSSRLRTEEKLANPLPSGRHNLPGTQEDVELFWSAGDSPSSTCFAVVVSDRSLADVEAVLAKCRHVGNAAFPKRAVLDPYAPETGMADCPPRTRHAHRLFDVAAKTIHPQLSGPMKPIRVDETEVWVGAAMMRPRAPQQEVTEDKEELERRVRGRIEELLRDTPARVMTPPGPGQPTPGK